MPHCVIECSKSLSAHVDFSELVKKVHDVTELSGLFSKGDVKARLITAEHYIVGGQVQDYVHVITHILSGRTIDQRKSLADAITLTLCELLPTVKMLSVEVREIEKQVYSNRAVVNKAF